MICPKCAHMLQEDCTKCPFCGNELDKDANPVTFDILICKIPTFIFLILSIITFGLYMIVWLYLIVRDINKLELKSKSKKINFWVLLAVILFTNVFVEHFLNIIISNKEVTSVIMHIIIAILLFIISHILLNKIEQYALEKYDVTIRKNRFLCFLFNFFYVNYSINSFSENIYNKKYYI